MARIKIKFVRAAAAVLVFTALGFAAVEVNQRNIDTNDFNLVRNALATKCANNEPFVSVEEFQLFVDLLNRQIENDGGKLIVENATGSLLVSVCKSLIR